MSINLQIYLKRTEQSMEDWMRANDVLRVEDLLPRCAYVGLAASPADVILATQIIERTKGVESPKLDSADVVEKRQRKKKGDDASESSG